MALILSLLTTLGRFPIALTEYLFNSLVFPSIKSNQKTNELGLFITSLFQYLLFSKSDNVSLSPFSKKNLLLSLLYGL
jgi:hypothetical protein